VSSQTHCHPHWAHIVCGAHAHLEVYHHQHPGEDCFYYCSERNNVVVLFGTLKVRKTSIMPKLVRLSQGNHGIKLTPWSRLVGGVYSFSLIFSFSTSSPALHAWLSQAPQISTTSLTSSLAISSVRVKSCKVSWRQIWIMRAKGTSPLPCQDHNHLYDKTSFARDSGYKRTLSKNDPGSMGNY